MKKCLKTLQASVVTVLVPVAIGTITSDPVQAALIVSPPSTTVVNFNEFSGGEFLDFVNYGSLSGPVQVGTNVGEDILWSGSTFDSIGNGALDLGIYRWDGNLDIDPADPNPRLGYIVHSGDYASSASTTFIFNSGPKSAVGVFTQYFFPSMPEDFGDLGPVFIKALDAEGTVIESYNLITAAPIASQGINGGAFRGIQRPDNDIYAFQISSQRPLYLDNLTFASIDPSTPPQSVPEPASILGLLGVMVLGGAGFLKRQPRKVFN